MLAQAPVIGAEVCQYENTSDGELLIDRHPKLENVWIVGGGSGHGFKHGPAVGAEVARLVTHGGFAEDRFRLASKTQHRERTVY
jgi:glycine/D-amino acid oxidase-like deaminating enzyme